MAPGIIPAGELTGKSDTAHKGGVFRRRKKLNRVF